MLSFHEMNSKISSSWKTIDSSTRTFCISLADMEAIKFKKNKKTPTMKRKYNKDKSSKKSPTSTTHEQQVSQWIQSTNTKKSNQPSNDMLIDDIWDNVCASVDVDFLSEDFFGLSSNSSDDMMSQVTSSTTSGSSSCSDSIISTVDISDDDIITLWKDTTVQEETAAVDEVHIVTPTKKTGQKKRMSLQAIPKRKTMAACKA